MLILWTLMCLLADNLVSAPTLYFFHQNFGENFDHNAFYLKLSDHYAFVVLPKPETLNRFFWTNASERYSEVHHQARMFLWKRHDVIGVAWHGNHKVFWCFALFEFWSLRLVQQKCLYQKYNESGAQKTRISVYRDEGGDLGTLASFFFAICPGSTAFLAKYYHFGVKWPYILT